MAMPAGGGLGVVVIGRNEGERLVRSLRSVLGRADAVVYVDSGSADGSASRATELGALVVELDPARPFTAARARNAGFERLEREVAELRYVQFVDGDCRIAPGWLEAARDHLEAHPEVGVASGVLREGRRAPPLLRRLAEIEWEATPGDVESCGGNALIRADLFRAVRGFRPELIAGEEPDFCLRARRAGHRIVHLAQEMGVHEGSLTRFGQWWRRQVRGGHAVAELAWLHRRGPEAFQRRELASILAWGAGVPLAAVAAAWLDGAFALAALAAYALLWLRIFVRHGADGAAALYASACLAGKFAGAQGALGFAWNRRVRRRSSPLIEYKPGDPPSSERVSACEERA